MLFGYSRDTWRTVILLAAATIAAGVLGGLFAYAAYDKPAAVTCGDLRTDVSERTRVANEVANDLAIEGHSHERVVGIVVEELDQICARESLRYEPVNSDLKGTIRQRLTSRASPAPPR